MKERTLAIIKPCAVRNRDVGAIIQDIEYNASGLSIVAMKQTDFSRLDAEDFYAEHVNQPFFKGLVDHTVSGPCIAIILEGYDAVSKWRRLIGPTDPNTDMSNRGDLRAKYGHGIPNNALHGSSDLASAQREIGILFPEVEQTTEAYLPGTVGEAIEVADTHQYKNAKLVLQLAGRQVQPPVIRFQRTSPEAVLPTRGSIGAAGLDVSSAQGVLIQDGETVAVDTGWNIAVPTGYEVQVRSRSGHSLKGLTVANSPGTVDADYRGPLKVILTFKGYPGTFAYRIEPGNRIAQLVLAPVTAGLVQEVETLDTTERGTAGFGSTGK